MKSRTRYSLFWALLAIICLGGMALRPTWNDSDYYVEVVNMVALGLKPHIDFPHIYTLLSTWIMLPFHSVLGRWFSPTAMSLLVGVFYLAVGWMTYSMLRRLSCPTFPSHMGAALTICLGISAGHLEFTLEPWCVFFGTLSLWCVICGKANWKYATLSGIFAASTFFCKQNGGIFLPAILLLSWVLLPKNRRFPFTLIYCLSVSVVAVLYLLAARWWLGDWSALPACLGKVPYSRSVGVARIEALTTLAKAFLWCLPVWLATAFSFKQDRCVKLMLLACCLLLVPAVVISPGDHNRYFIAPFLGLLLGIGLRDVPSRLVSGLLLFYVAEICLRGVLYFPEPLKELCDHGSKYPQSDVALVDALREHLGQADRLLVVPQDGNTSVARFYVLSQAIPTTLDIRHQENLGWGTEFKFGDDAYIRKSISNSTFVVAHRDTQFTQYMKLVEELGFKHFATKECWDLWRLNEK